KSAFLCVLATVVTVLLLTTPGTRAAALTCGTWNVISSPNVASSNNTLRSVAAVSASDIWAVGDYLSASGANPVNKTLIEHWNGSSWSVVASPVGSGNDQLAAVAAVSASNIWAVGNNGNTLIEHWNGTSWSVVASPNPGSVSNGLTAVAAVSASNI